MAISTEQTLALAQQFLQPRLRQPVGSAVSGAAGEHFAGKLDAALGRGAVLQEASPEGLQQAAELLQLNSMRSTLELLGNQERTAPDGLESLVGLTGPAVRGGGAEMQAYLAQLAAAAEKTGQHPTAASGQPLPEPGPRAVEQLAARQETAAPALNSPVSLEQIVDRASERYGVDAGLIKAVIKAESNFNPRAVSSAGAQGLMQLMPATARSLGVSNPFDPEQNVMGGTRFLRDLLNRYHGDLDAALAAYNWGPGNVDRRPDRLPRETRDYLVKVKQYYQGFSA